MLDMRNENNRQVIFIIILMIAIFGGGTAGYIVIEDYSFSDAIFMTIITVTTVGFGEVQPLTPEGRIFTSALILLGFASLAFAVHIIMGAIINRVINSTSEIKKMEKQISKLKEHYIICGFGRVGMAAVEKFKQSGTDFVVIDTLSDDLSGNNEEQILHLKGDALDEDTLINASIKSASGLLALLPSDADNLYITLTARELNPTLHIIARAEGTGSEKKLLQAGADSVISPFTAAGRKIAANMLAATINPQMIQDTLHVQHTVPQWIEVMEGSSMVLQTIGEVAAEMKHKVFGLRRKETDYLDPEYSIKLEIDDKLLVMATENSYSEEQEIKTHVPQKIVIVDDNPVVLKLYSRLLRRSGFVPLSATKGSDALQLILDEKPDAAVIDFMLPVISGIEICKNIRKKPEYDNVKLILFTGDDDNNTRERAMKAGANAVVIKGPESSELIETVIYLLKQGELQKNVA